MAKYRSQRRQEQIYLGIEIAIYFLERSGTSFSLKQEPKNTRRLQYSDNVTADERTIRKHRGDSVS